VKPIAVIVIGFLIFVASSHLVRLAMGWKVTIGSREMPRWFSLLALVFVASLAALLWWESFGPQW
jgi:hypothetical protein